MGFYFYCFTLHFTLHVCEKFHAQGRTCLGYSDFLNLFLGAILLGLHLFWKLLSLCGHICLDTLRTIMKYPGTLFSRRKVACNDVHPDSFWSRYFVWVWSTLRSLFFGKKECKFASKNVRKKLPLSRHFSAFRTFNLLQGLHDQTDELYRKKLRQFQRQYWDLSCHLAKNNLGTTRDIVTEETELHPCANLDEGTSKYVLDNSGRKMERCDWQIPYENSDANSMGLSRTSSTNSLGKNISSLDSKDTSGNFTSIDEDFHTEEIYALYVCATHMGKNGNSQELRLLLDTGAYYNLIDEKKIGPWDVQNLQKPIPLIGATNDSVIAGKKWQICRYV